MKQLHRCPKCAGKKIWVIEKYRVPGEAPEGVPLPVLPHQRGARATLFVRAAPVGHFDLYLCDACGYSELWADGFRDLQPSPETGIRLLDTEAQAGPFR